MGKDSVYRRLWRRPRKAKAPS